MKEEYTKKFYKASNDATKTGFKQGSKQEKEDIAKKMLKDKLDVETILNILIYL